VQRVSCASAELRFFPRHRPGHGAAEGGSGDRNLELVTAGLITADGFDNLRALIDPKRRAGQGTGRRRASPHSSGRWFALVCRRPSRTRSDRDRRAGSHLQRSFAPLRRGFSRGPGPRKHSAALAGTAGHAAAPRRPGRSARREVRHGFSGRAIRAAHCVESLRAMRREPAAGETVTVSAADPLNLVGMPCRGPRGPPIRRVCHIPRWRGRGFGNAPCGNVRGTVTAQPRAIHVMLRFAQTCDAVAATTKKTEKIAGEHLLQSLAHRRCHRAAIFHWKPFHAGMNACCIFDGQRLQKAAHQPDFFPFSWWLRRRRRRSERIAALRESREVGAVTVPRDIGRKGRCQIRGAPSRNVTNRAGIGGHAVPGTQFPELSGSAAETVTVSPAAGSRRMARSDSTAMAARIARPENP